MARSLVKRTFKQIIGLLGLEGPRIDRAKYWIWHGFSESAIRELNAILENPRSSTSRRAAAAFELAWWFCGLEEYETALRYLDLSSRNSRLSLQRRRLGKILAAVLAATGTESEKQRFIEEHRLERDLDMRLALANVARTTQLSYPELDPLVTLNEAYASNGLCQIRKIDDDAPHSIDNLTGQGSTKSFGETDDLVSVIMPAWRAASTIKTAMRSVAEQSYPNLEVVVVDDASEDGTPEIVDAFARSDSRFRLVRLRKNIGSYACRNLGLSHVKGKFVTVQDADDWSHPNKIAAQISHLRGSGAPYNLAMWVRADNALHFRSNDAYSSRILGPDHSSAMFSYQILEKFGGWDNVRISADTELMWQIESSVGRPREHLKSRRILEDCPLSIGRIDPSSLTRQSRTHISTIRFGVRNEYRDAAAHWHDRLSAHQDRKQRLKRNDTLFPVPAFIKARHDREPDPGVMVIGNFDVREFDHENFRLLRAIAESKAAPCAIFHYPDYEVQASVKLSSLVRSYAWDHGIRIVVSGEQISVGLVIMPDARLMRYRLDSPPKVTTKFLKISNCNEIFAEDPKNKTSLGSRLARHSILVESGIEYKMTVEEIIRSISRK
jgi:glycosyltransferase involved in cell wall biosynthesis